MIETLNGHALPIAEPGMENRRGTGLAWLGIHRNFTSIGFMRACANSLSTEGTRFPSLSLEDFVWWGALFVRCKRRRTNQYLEIHELARNAARSEFGSPTHSRMVEPLRSMFAAGGHEARDQNFVGSLLWPNPQRDCNTHARHHYDTAMFSNFRIFQLSAKSCPYTHPKGSGDSVPNRAPNRRRNNQVVLAYEPSESGCRAWAPNVRIACN